MLCYARFALANPTPQLGSDLVGGKLEQSNPVSCRDPLTLADWHIIHTSVSVGTVKESYLLQLHLKDSCIVHVWLLIGRRGRAISNRFRSG